MLKITHYLNLLLLFLLLTAGQSAQGQSIFSNEIDGGNPSASNPFTSGQVVDPNLSVSGIGRGSGISPNAGSNRYNANSWNTADIDLDAYFEFTLTPDMGYAINFTGFTYTGQRSPTGPVNFAFRSSVDGFASNVGSPTATGATIALSAAAYQDISSAITFRLYGWGAGPTGTYSVNDFTFEGEVVEVSLPVRLLHFKGALREDQAAVELTFATAAETNNDFFAIERSNDGRVFTTIGQVAGQHTTDEEQHYQFIDEQPAPGYNYYRLKQVDFDGQYTYYGPLAVHLLPSQLAAADQLEIWPLPTTVLLNVSLPSTSQKTQQWVLEVYGLDGRLLQQEKIVAFNPVTHQLSTARLLPGSYLLRWSNAYQAGQQLFVKQ